MKIHLILFSILLLFNFGSFIWGALRHFEIRGKAPKGMIVLSILIILAKVAMLSACFISQAEVNAGFLLGILAEVISTALFWRCVGLNRRKPLTAAYTDNPPLHLQQRGPYQYVRHPFYTSYMLSFVGGALATQLLWAGAVVLIPVIIYTHASRYEEAKFSKSDLKAQYALYKRQAGRFIPKISQLIRQSPQRFA